MPTKLISSHDSAHSPDSVIGRDGLITESNAVDTADKNNLGLGGDGRTPKNFQKSTSDGNIAFRRPAYDISLNSTKGLNESKFTVSGRRQSIKDSKTSQSVSTMQSSPSKRSAPLGYQRSAATTRLRNPQSGQALGNGTPNFHSETPTLVSHDDTSNLLGPVDFLPFVNFDDFHESLTSGEHYRDQYQAPDHLQGDLMASSGVSIGKEHDSQTKIPLRNAGPADSGYRIGRSGSLLRQNSNRTRANAQPVSSIQPSLAAVDSMSSNPRRKSYFPSSTINATTAQSPRKSVGPGSLTQNLDNDLGVGPNIGYSESRSRERDGSNLSAVPRTSVDIPIAQPRSRDTSFPSVSAARQSKTKSLHIPSKLTQDPFSCAFGTPDTTISSTSTPRPTGRPLAQRTVTPTSSKRMSIMPNSAHATGLAARTISPTDARRLKRMSVMPTAPPLPYTPPFSQPDPPLAREKTAPSPSLVPRKASTPTSSRTTPEMKRKSYSSGISNSSTTSYNSCQSFNGPPRIPQSFSSSRLPMLKTRSEPLPSGGEEEVPPVPAIPKAYESPKMDVDQPFFSSRKSSLPYDASSLTSASTADGLPTPSTDNEGPGLPRKSSLKKTPTNESGQMAEKKVPSMISNNRRTLQPLRLPPLNLLPLSTPTAAKIDALFDGTVGASLGTVTPPPKIRSVATPTTPMTASRASFFAKSQQREDPMPDRAQIRSSSSHYVLRLDPSLYDDSNCSKTTIAAGHARLTRKAVSPFTSASLPKTSGEFGYARHGISSVTDSKLDCRPSRLTDLHLQKTYKASKEDASSTEDPSPVDVSTPSFGSSLRRKLSLTHKRSTSKTQSRAESEDEAPPKPPRHDHMPPPRLPASATWSGPLLSSPSPTHKNNQLPTRKKPPKPVTPQHERNRSSTWTANGAPQKGLVSIDPATASAASKRTVRSTLEGGFSSNALSLKDFLKEAKKMETQLDRDDQQAEEEMRRLASKRKDAEMAAREIDALRRRATAKDRLSPNKALRTTNLNIFERGEIVDYREIYFCGTCDAKKHVGDLNAESTNFGYDDNRGDYNIVPGDHLAYRYEMVDILGKGSFGQVVRCVDHKTGTLVAIKIIRNKKRFHQQALVEVDILQKLRDWDPQRKHSMVEFTQSFYFRGHLCISTELLGMNLYEFIKCHDFRGFSLKLIRRFAKQLLNSLILLKHHRVIHCDLKPENILLTHPARSEIKVIDFGSSCMENEKVYTYIQSRFYRSPEVILGMTYGMPIDMWSLGCILAELLTGYPIFPGENEQEQLACIMEVFGPPEKHLIEKSTRKKLFFDSLGKPRLTVSAKGKRRRPSSKTLQQALKCEDEAFLDFITRCLRWDPERRLKPDDAIRHEFISGIKPSTRTINRPQATSVSNSPVKRFNSTTTPASVRPLPEPPATSFKTSTTTRNREGPNASPSKNAAAVQKRHSTINGLQTGGAGVKRSLNGVAVSGSALPRVAGRSVSGKPDLAAAAAVASLVRD